MRLIDKECPLGCNDWCIHAPVDDEADRQKFKDMLHLSAREFEKKYAKEAS